MPHSGKPFNVARLSDVEMLAMETIRKIKLAHGRDGKTIGQIVRDFSLSRNTVRKVHRSEANGHLDMSLLTEMKTKDLMELDA